MDINAKTDNFTSFLDILKQFPIFQSRTFLYIFLKLQ